MFIFWSKEIKLKSKTEILIGGNPSPEMKQRNWLIVLGTGCSDGKGASNVVGRGVCTISNAAVDHSIDSVLDHEYSTDNGKYSWIANWLERLYISHLFSPVLLWMIKSILDIHFTCLMVEYR